MVRGDFRRRVACVLLAAALCLPLSGLGGAAAEPPAFRQGLAEAAASDDAVAEFYRMRDYAPIWTTAADAARREALFRALGAVVQIGA